MQLCAFEHFFRHCFFLCMPLLCLWVEHWGPLWCYFDWGGGAAEKFCLPANPANQFCLISHCTLSPTNPPQRGGTLSHCVCQQRKASRGGICLTGTTHTSLPPLSLACQSTGRQSSSQTITFILSMFCCRR